MLCIGKVARVAMAARRGRLGLPIAPATFPLEAFNLNNASSTSSVTSFFYRSAAPPSVPFHSPPFLSAKLTYTTSSTSLLHLPTPPVHNKTYILLCFPVDVFSSPNSSFPVLPQLFEPQTSQWISHSCSVKENTMATTG